jgi:hypothetical protein
MQMSEHNKSAARNTPLHPQMSPLTNSIPSDWGSPRSPSFNPILGSIPEVYEYEVESPDAEHSPLIKVDTHQDLSEAFIPELTINEPELTKSLAAGTVIQISRKIDKAYSVRRVLRKVLAADKIRRRRVMKVYLKAMTFLKYMLKAHDRYGAVMMTSGVYMQR